MKPYLPENTKVVIRTKDRIDYIMNGLCSFWDVDIQYFYTRAQWNSPNRALRKKIAIQLLYDVAGCSLKEVTGALGYKPNAIHSVWEHKAQMNELLDKNHYGSAEVRREYAKILNHLGL